MQLSKEAGRRVGVRLVSPGGTPPTGRGHLPQPYPGVNASAVPALAPRTPSALSPPQEEKVSDAFSSDCQIATREGPVPYFQPPSRAVKKALKNDQ